MSLFPLKYVLELYLVIILFDAIILVYFFCYVHMASLCHFINQLNLKKIFSFHFSHFSYFFSLCPLPGFSKACSLLCSFHLDFHFCDIWMGLAKKFIHKILWKNLDGLFGQSNNFPEPWELISFCYHLTLKNEFSASPWSSVLSFISSASISDFSRFPQRWPLPLFSPSCCFLGREVGKDQLFQIGHSNCITNNLTSLLYSDWLLSLQDSWDQLLLTSLASFSVFSTLSTVNSGFISLKAQHLSLFKTLNHLSLPFLCSLPGWLLHIFQFSTEKVTSLRSSPWLPSWCSTTLSSLQCSAPFLLVLGIRTLHYLPPMLP